MEQLRLQVLSRVPLHCGRLDLHYCYFQQPFLVEGSLELSERLEPPLVNCLVSNLIHRLYLYLGALSLGQHFNFLHGCAGSQGLVVYLGKLFGGRLSFRVRDELLLLLAVSPDIYIKMALLAPVCSK